MTDYLLLAVMPLLLVGSALFSGSETAFFGMGEADRMHFRRTGGFRGRAVARLLADQQMLLITIMLGNMTINSLYFVVSSVLILRLDVGVGGAAGIAVGSLLLIILLGEVLPKMIANARRISVISFVAPLLATLHQVILPVRIVVASAIVTPLSRLTAPSGTPPRLSGDELEALLDLSGQQGVIDADEQRVIREVFSLSRLRVRDVMTPRVEMTALPAGASRLDVIAATERARLTRIPVYENDLDNIVGVLNVKRFLQREDGVTVRSSLDDAMFVPQIASLDQLLNELRRKGRQSAIVVDEFGGTAGVVAVRDVVEEIVGDIVAEDEVGIEPPRLIDTNRWRASGDMSVHDWAEFFGQTLVSSRISTLGGLITHKLGRSPNVGDAVQLGNVRLEVAAVSRSRVESVLISLVDSESPTSPEIGS